MIKSISIENFKSLQKVDLLLGHLNLFVGTNASGKSNFFDALRVLQGIGYGFTVDEIFNGKPKSAGSDVWEQIRGGAAKALFVGRTGDPAVANGANCETISFKVKLESGGKDIDYEIGLSPSTGSVVSETLRCGGKDLYYTDEVLGTSPVVSARYVSGNKGQPLKLDFQKSKPVLHQITKRSEFKNKDHHDAVQACIRGLSNFQRIDPSPAVLREYSPAHTVKRMGERGENFAALVQTFIADPAQRSAYLSWLTQLTPTELDDVQILKGAVGEPLFALREAGVDRPAQILSDGTLRFAAITAAFFQGDMPDVMTIEEIENGIHPSRLRLLVEMLRSQTAKRERQIMATTHSPIVLAWLSESEYQHTFFCRRDDVTGASKICPLNQIPDFVELVRKRPIGDLFAEGWLEGAL